MGLAWENGERRKRGWELAWALGLGWNWDCGTGLALGLIPQSPSPFAQPGPGSYRDVRVIATHTLRRRHVYAYMRVNAQRAEGVYGVRAWGGKGTELNPLTNPQKTPNSISQHPTPARTSQLPLSTPNPSAQLPRPDPEFPSPGSAGPAFVLSHGCFSQLFGG